jgi:hypothetical protein
MADKDTVLPSLIDDALAHAGPFAGQIGIGAIAGAVRGVLARALALTRRAPRGRLERRPRAARFWCAPAAQRGTQRRRLTRARAGKAAALGVGALFCGVQAASYWRAAPPRAPLVKPCAR